MMECKACSGNWRIKSITMRCNLRSDHMDIVTTETIKPTGELRYCPQCGKKLDMEGKAKYAKADMMEKMETELDRLREALKGALIVANIAKSEARRQNETETLNE